LRLRLVVPGYDDLRAGGGSGLALTEYRPAFEDILRSETLYAYAARQPEARQFSGRAPVYAVAIPGCGDVVIRHSMRGGLIGKTGSDLFLPPTRALREVVIPVLRTYPAVRIWHAGCSTGEEVYSAAILLREEGLYDRCQLYATDINEAVLRQARRGEVPLAAMRENTRNYIEAAGRQAFARWYSVRDDRAVLDPELRRNIVFAQHNLATDHSFNEFHLIVCRNVLIYFNRALQDRVHRLLYQSLIRFGFLGLGAKETIRFTPHEAHYQEMPERLYRKVA